MARSEGNILLHPTLGINPRLTFCVRCGGDAGIAMLGIKNYVDVCQSCKCEHVGGSDKRGQCMRCGGYNLTRRRLKPNEKVPGGWCQSCEDKQAECDEAVREGGVYWRCSNCGTEGAVKKDNPIAIDVRRKAEADGMEPGAPIGVQFDECPVCRKSEEESGDGDNGNRADA